MSRLIDADALIKFIENRYDITWKDDYEGGIKDACTDVLEEINKMPTIELERKTGKWIDEGFYADGHGAHAFRCSECGGHIIEYDADPFCKWCGADMRGEEDNIPIEYFESGGK